MRLGEKKLGAVVKMAAVTVGKKVEGVSYSRREGFCGMTGDGLAVIPMV